MESNLKSLANLAKQRLKNGKYNHEVVKDAQKSKAKASDYFYQNMLSLKKKNYIAEFTKIDNNEDIKLTKKIMCLLEHDEVPFNPIGLLLDKDYYRTLSDYEKQYYILKLCDKYNKVKDEYMLQKIS